MFYHGKRYIMLQEIIVVCTESEMDGFLADSESSDSESTMSSDLEISEMVCYFYMW